MKKLIVLSIWVITLIQSINLESFNIKNMPCDFIHSHKTDIMYFSILLKKSDAIQILLAIDCPITIQMYQAAELIYHEEANLDQEDKQILTSLFDQLIKTYFISHNDNSIEETKGNNYFSIDSPQYQLIKASQEGNINKIHELIQSGADPNESCNSITPIDMTITHLKPFTLSMLIKEGAKPTKEHEEKALSMLEILKSCQAGTFVSDDPYPGDNFNEDVFSIAQILKLIRENAN